MKPLPASLRVPLVAGLAAGSAGLWWYLRQPGRKVSTVVQEVTALAGTRTLTGAQQVMVDVIMEEFGATELFWLVPAAVVNAYAESRLDPKAAGDGGSSIGLFQLHKNGGGKGMTVAERENPVLNTRRIIREAIAAGMASTRGHSNADLAALFAQKVERCAECGVKPGDSRAQLDYRHRLTYELYGAAVAERVP